MSSPTQILYKNEDNLVRLDLAQLASTDAYVNAGTATWELKDDDDASLATGTLSYVAASDGRWQGAIDKDDVADVTVGGTYWLEVTIDNGSGAEGFRRIQLIAQYHND